MNFKQILMSITQNDKTTSDDKGVEYRNRWFEQTSLDMTTSPQTITKRYRNTKMILTWELWRDGLDPSYRCFYKTFVAVVKQSKKHPDRWRMSINSELGGLGYSSSVVEDDDIYSLSGAVQKASNVFWYVFHKHAPWEMIDDE